MGIRDSIQSILISNQDILEEYKYYGESEDEFIDYLEALSNIFGIEEIKDRDSLIEFISEYDYYHVLNYRFYYTPIEKLRVRERYKNYSFKDITSKRQFFDQVINKIGSVMLLYNYKEEERAIKTTYDKLMGNFTMEYAEYLLCAFFESKVLKYEAIPIDWQNEPESQIREKKEKNFVAFQNAVRQQSIVSTEQFMEELITYPFVLTEGGAIVNSAVSFFGPLRLSGEGEEYLYPSSSSKNLLSVEELGINIFIETIRENYIDCFSRIDHLRLALFEYFPYTQITIYTVHDYYAADDYRTHYRSIDRSNEFNFALSFTAHVKYALEQFPDLQVIRFTNCLLVSVDPEKIGPKDYAEYQDKSEPHNQTRGVSTLNELEEVDFRNIVIRFDHCWIDEDILAFLRKKQVMHNFETRVVYDHELNDYHNFEGPYYKYEKSSYLKYSFPHKLDWMI